MGFEIVGIDVSEQMLEQASAKADGLDAEARAKVTFTRGDVRSWLAPEPFDLVIVPCSTLSHLLSLEEQLSTWRRAHDNLAAGGGATTGCDRLPKPRARSSSSAGITAEVFPTTD